MRKSVDTKVQEVFQEPRNREAAEGYLATIRDNWREVSTSMSRDFTLILLLMGVFELLSQAAIAKASVGPFEISDLSLVRKILPVVIAYLVFDLSILAWLDSDYLDAHTSLMRIIAPEVEHSDLDLLLIPRRPSLANPLLLGVDDWPSRPILSNFKTGLPYVIALGVAAFQVYAYYLQFREFDNDDPIVWATLLVSVVLTSYALWLSHKPFNLFSRDGG